ncbi:Gag-Pol polyprotein [Plecturocebus cupreus]
MLLQYVDDLLLGRPTAVGCAKETDALLRHLEVCGYKVSEKKAQICQQQVGFTIWQGERSLGAERKQAICNLPDPETRRQIANPELCSTGQTPIHSDKAGEIRNPLDGDPRSSRPIELKVKLLSAPALGPPDLTKPLTLSVSERLKKMAVEVLTSTLGQNLNIKAPHTVYVERYTKKKAVKFRRERTFSKQVVERIESLGKMCQETELKLLHVNKGLEYSPSEATVERTPNRDPDHSHRHKDLRGSLSLDPPQLLETSSSRNLES